MRKLSAAPPYAELMVWQEDGVTIAGTAMVTIHSDAELAQA
eukprot:gene8916-8070_t